MATTGIVENYPGFTDGIDGFELAEKMQEGAEKFGAETVYDTGYGKRNGGRNGKPPSRPSPRSRNP